MFKYPLIQHQPSLSQPLNQLIHAVLESLRDICPGNPLIWESVVLSQSAPWRRTRRHYSIIPNIHFVCGCAMV